MAKKHNPTAIYLLSDVKDEELRAKLEHQFIAFETLKRMNVEASRAAFRAQSLATKATAEVQLAQLDFLIDAAEAFDLIATEPMWMIRRRGGDGEVILECLLTEKDMQQLARAQTKQMKDQISEMQDHSDEGEDDDDDMFKNK